MENNSVKSLFTWASNTKKTGRLLCFEFKTGLFHTLGLDEEGLSQVTGEDARCHPKIFTAQEADEVSLTQSKFLSGLCPVGVSSEVWGQPGEDTIRELGNPPRVQGHIHSKRFKSKNMWKKKITTCEKQALLNSLSNTKAI